MTKYFIRTQSLSKNVNGNYFPVMYSQKAFDTHQQAQDYIQGNKEYELSLCDNEGEKKEIESRFSHIKIIQVEQTQMNVESGYLIDLSPTIPMWINE